MKISGKYNEYVWSRSVDHKAQHILSVSHESLIDVVNKCTKKVHFWFLKSDVH